MAMNGVSPIRFTGMASGIDTEAIVKQMLASDKAKMDKVYQNKQTLRWKQEAYREIIDDLNSLKNTYFDVLSKDYMLSSNALSGFDISYSEENVAKVSATAGMVAGDYTVKVTQLAKAAKKEGTTLITNENKSNGVGAINDWKDAVITFNVNGTDTSITLGNSFNDMTSLINDINEKISANSELNGNISVSNDGGAVKFNTITNETIIISDAKKSGGVDNLTDLTTDLKGKVLNPNASTKLSDLGIESNSITLQFTLNGVLKPVTIDNSLGDKTIKDLNNAISDATNGEISGRISELTGKFTLETSGTGSSTSLKIEETTATSLLSSIGITGAGIRIVNEVTGQDAQAEITPPGSVTSTTVTRSSNKFSIDNVNYELIKEGETSVVSIAPNIDKTFDKVEDFIGKYNELVGKISSKLEEKKSYSFKPLTQEEKESMGDEEVEKWEKKAKEGILRNDGVLEKMLSSLRIAFFDSVDGAGISFSKSQLGLDTSSDIGQRGKIIIKNAEKFKEALTSNGEQVMRLFTQSADISYSRNLSAADRKNRYDNSGILQRLSDIIEDNISTYRKDVDGTKGTLLEKAGIKDDTSFLNNMLTKQIETKDKLIKELTTKMFNKENRLYQQFAKLEQAMNGMNAQSDWLASQLGGA